MNLSKILCGGFSVIFLSASAGAATGTAITALPTPDEGGAYVFGNVSYTSPSFDANDSGGFSDGLHYPVWDEINVPSGSTVKFVGGIALSSLPADCTFDFSGATHVLAANPAALGSGMTVPAGVNLLLQPVTVTVANGVATFASGSSAYSVSSPLDIGGKVLVGRKANVVFNAAVAGSETGHIFMNGWDRTVTFNGPLDFSGLVQINASQRASKVIVKSPDSVARLGKFEASDYDNSRSDKYASREPPQLIYRPTGDGAHTLVVSNFNHRGYGGLAEPSGVSNYRRWGTLLSTCSNNTIKVEDVVYGGPIHVVAASNGAYTFGHEPAFDEGFGNFEFVNFGYTVAGSHEVATVSATFYPSPNVNLKFTGRFVGSYNQQVFNYTAESNVVNCGTLDMSGSDSYRWNGVKDPNVKVVGYSPWNLPRTIKCPRVALQHPTVVTVSSTQWRVPLDFREKGDDVSIARCMTDAKLDVPSSGTIVVSRAEGAESARPVAGRYPVITGLSGAAALANWSLEAEASLLRHCQISLSGDDTGLYVVVDVKFPTTIIMR